MYTVYYAHAHVYIYRCIRGSNIAAVVIPRGLGGHVCARVISCALSAAAAAAAPDERYTYSVLYNIILCIRCARGRRPRVFDAAAGQTRVGVGGVAVPLLAVVSKLTLLFHA